MQSTLAHSHTPAALLRGEGVRKGQASTPLGVEPSQQESLPVSLRRVEPICGLEVVCCAPSEDWC